MLHRCLRDRRLKCGIHVIVSVRRIVLDLPAASDARPPRVGSLPSRLAPVPANSEIPSSTRPLRSLCAVIGWQPARPFLTGLGDILRPRLAVADSGADGGEEGII